ncbi:protein of unknown function [Magnetospirillum gryphiswaldense MSR-1 v2]|uniref:Uncharacterized protein n=1 Tax=Magnetospirillum gryphiswaldense (strain DSM 6361 / JCM 21280 / NBRC 15271 / MSR-1) TaxID=431944 RepID=V6EZS0_MAGGM|nr:protein of unknown function [Magnetospirillum gryphiswaldense MSR-1 v2]
MPRSHQLLKELWQYLGQIGKN